MFYLLDSIVYVVSWEKLKKADLVFARGLWHCMRVPIRGLESDDTACEYQYVDSRVMVHKLLSESTQTLLWHPLSLHVVPLELACPCICTGTKLQRCIKSVPYFNSKIYIRMHNS